MTFTYADIFAGIGGFHAALDSLGGECVLAVEKDKQAARVYQDNWGMDPRGDVTDPSWMAKLEEYEKGQLDVLAGGPPCQAFSKSGAQRGMDEARGTLFFNTFEAIERWQPKIVILENVRNLTGPRHVHEWEVIIRSLRELGYRVSSTPLIVSPHRVAPGLGGTPQNRERVYILGTYVGVEEAAEEVGLTVDLERWGGEWDLFRDLPMQVDGELATGEWESLKASPGENEWCAAWSDLVARLRAAGVKVPAFMWSNYWGLEEADIPEGFSAWKRGFYARNAAFYLENQEVLDGWMGSWNPSSFPESRQRIEWQAGMADLDDIIYQMRPSGMRAKHATYVPGLVAIDQRPVVARLGRRLSVRECARLQGFGDGFSFDSVSERQAVKQLGNSVCVGVVRAVFEAHLRAPETVLALGDDSALLRALSGSLTV